jgi:acetamidase/formamidase
MNHRHHLASTPEHCHWGYFDAALPPVITIASGDVVTIDCVSGGADVLPTDGPFQVLEDHRAILAALTPKLPGHILTGPVAVEGAEPGDALEIEILSIECRQNWGWSAIRPLAGSLPEDFPMRKLWRTGIDSQRGVATLPWGLELPLAPFFGVMGTAPPPVYGAVTSIVPREFGGNIDCKELTAGSTLFLPVFAPGGLFSAGDGHGLQGDGEVCLTALETALRGTFRLTVRKDLKLDMPRARTATHHITFGLNEDLDDAAKQALRQMIAFITAQTKLPAEDAYMLCSLACDLHVTQLVDGNKGVHAMLPISALA